MGDFFLLQMDDSLTEGLCFDISKEGEGGADSTLPHCAKDKAKGRSKVGQGAPTL
jgi:hypothetical protein